MSKQTSIESRSRSLANGVLLMQAFDEQFLAFLSCLEELAEKYQHSTAREEDYELGFQTGMGNGIWMVLGDLRMFYGDFKHIQAEISAAVTSEPRS